MMIKQTVLLMTMFRYGADNDEYDNLNDDNINYFVCVILSFSRSGTNARKENNKSLSYSEVI